MSRLASPHDNALAESFVATLKSECWSDPPPSRALARHRLFDYIEAFYNTRRRHSALGYRSPAQFEADALARRASKGSQGCSGGGRPGGETGPLGRSAHAAGSVNNSAAELFKPPETTHSPSTPPTPLSLPKP